MIPTPLARVRAFEELGFGMFVHWGLYSQLGAGEWVMNRRKMSVAEYRPLFENFTACDFNADELVLTAKNAGAKYIVLTSRHHDGFSLYDTCGLSDYDAPHSPAGRDLIREYVDACNRHGIIPFFYHTTLDWYKPEFESDFDKYLDYLHSSVELLCKNYGKIGGLWFDGNWSKPGADWKEDRLYATIRKHQPEAIIVNNTGLGSRGKVGNIEIDSVTFEQGRPTPMNREGMEKYIAAEMCETINDHWGVASCDLNNKSTAQLIETLCACRKVGANYLLNIGPTAQGGIDELQKCTLAYIGRWVKTFESAIRAPKPCEIAGSGKDFALRSGNKVYFFIHDLGIGGSANVTLSSGKSTVRSFVGVKEKVKGIRWIDNGEELAFSQIADKGILTFNATNYPYGVNFVVRVAEAEI